MSGRGVRTRAPARARVRNISELAVIVQFGDLVVALPAHRVSRIVLASEVVAVSVRGPTPHVQIGGHAFPAWDMGQMLGLGGVPAAWLIMRTTDDPGAPEIALGTGPCVAIAAHDVVAPLPYGVVTAPHAAVLGVFATDAALRARGVGELGVRVDPVRLIGASALDAVSRSGP